MKCGMCRWWHPNKNEDVRDSMKAVCKDVAPKAKANYMLKRWWCAIKDSDDCSDDTACHHDSLRTWYEVFE